MEHFPVALDADIARRAAGGRRHLREEVTRLDVALGDGLVVPVEVRRRPGRFGGLRWVLVCVACGRDVMKLRHIHEAPWLACKRDVSRYAAKYVTQGLCPPIAPCPAFRYPSAGCPVIFTRSPRVRIIVHCS